jgi:hypothetical protein
MTHYAGYDEESLLPTAQLMLTYILRAVKHESFFKKYAAKKYMKVSIYVRDWAWAKFGAQSALEYDAEGEPTTGTDPYMNVVRNPAAVSLVEEIPRLREEIRLVKEHEQEAIEKEMARQAARDANAEALLGTVKEEDEEA